MALRTKLQIFQDSMVSQFPEETWEHNINIANLGYLVEGGSEIYYVVDRDGGAVATRGRNTGC